MGSKSRIEWTDATWNPLVAYRGDKRGWHCEKISPACDHCYAASMNKRSDGLVGIGTGLNYAPDSRAKLRFEIDEKTLRAPEKWRRPRRVFPCSMTDIFGGWHSDEQLDRVFAEMALCRNHTFQVLTKRIDRAHQYLSTPDRAKRIGRVFGVWPLPNVWLGVTAENQQLADERIPLLLRTPAAVRFLSAEPLLGPIDLDRCYREHGPDGLCDHEDSGLDWVITGGESGPGARPSHPDWFRSLRDQCVAAGVPFFFKQWGEFGPDKPMPNKRWSVIDYEGNHAPQTTAWNGKTGEWSETNEVYMYPVGKAAAGRKLDGVEWSQFPEAANA